MFDTSVVKTRTVAAHKHYSVLVISIAFHAAAGIAILVTSIANVRFPKDAPRSMSFFTPTLPVSLPLPKGNPDAPRNPVAQPPQPKQPAAAPPRETAPQLEVTPTVIPSTTPTLTSPEGDPNANATPSGSGERWGDPEGDPNVVDIGQTGLNPAPATPDVVYTVGANVKSAVVIHRVQPKYPRLAIAGGINGHVVIHCVIDKHGRMRDPQIMRSTNPIFNQSALEALSQWRFVAGSMNGQPVDTYFDLTIHFEVRR